MRRWLLALFALQFFCSVSALPYANTDPIESPEAVASAMIEVAKPATDAAPSTTASSALDPVHGLLDDIPELPECLDVGLGMVTAATPWETPSGHLITEWLPPALDGPQRPPRSLQALV